MTKALCRIILIVSAVFILHSSLFCEEDYFLKLDQLLIESSNKTVVKYEDLSENLRVIPARFLQEYNIKTISDLIPYISSMYLSRYRSGEALIYTLGILNSHNEKILLLINGTPVYDPFYNKSVIDEYYPLDNVDHIEIAIGPYSSLYGTGTFAGYINIVEKKKFPNSVKLNGASTERFRSSYSFSGVIDGIEYRTAITHLEDKGIGTDVNYKDKPDLLEEDPKKNTLIRAGISFKGFNLSVINVNYRFKELNQDVYTWA
ncbi:TonB-dependent receptor plug domain-containing protein, partial [Candidatus Calescamantes bacterium]|nr:TonB-dependent receptor plug domain-containing protein [Candidatus Calescamantes bacterium]